MVGFELIGGSPACVIFGRVIIALPFYEPAQMFRPLPKTFGRCFRTIQVFTDPPIRRADMEKKKKVNASLTE
jgi:hypothetical protein